jgi:uncharacterized phiE125 gp8 family phage protein
VSLQLITAPALEPITLSEMKIQCGLGPMEDSDQLREQILAEQLRPAMASAREQCEAMCARAFITQTWQMTLDRFPRWKEEYEVHHRLDIRLPLPTFQELVSFTYLDYSGTEQDMMVTGSWGYQLVKGGDTRMERIRPPAGRGWPITEWQSPDAVTISFNCGFGDMPADVPHAVRTAVEIMAQWIYEGCKGAQPQAIQALLTPYIIDIV